MSNQTPTHAQIEIRRRKFARKMGGTEFGKGKQEMGWKDTEAEFAWKMGGKEFGK